MKKYVKSLTLRDFLRKSDLEIQKNSKKLFLAENLGLNQCFPNYYALIRTYIETCRRNGINEYQALVRLCDDNPYTVNEIFSQN